MSNAHLFLLFVLSLFMTRRPCSANDIVFQHSSASSKHEPLGASDSFTTILRKTSQAEEWTKVTDMSDERLRVASEYILQQVMEQKCPYNFCLSYNASSSFQMKVVWAKETSYFVYTQANETNQVMQTVKLDMTVQILVKGSCAEAFRTLVSHRADGILYVLKWGSEIPCQAISPASRNSQPRPSSASGNVGILTSPSSSPSTTPSASPTATTAPSTMPSSVPSAMPTTTAIPSQVPTTTSAPSLIPSTSPSASPTVTAAPSVMPSSVPSAAPTTTAIPSQAPTATSAPSLTPSTSPSASPTVTAAPSAMPSSVPSAMPTTTAIPSQVPTTTSAPSLSPSTTPSASPKVTAAPSTIPSSVPSAEPTTTAIPSQVPTTPKAPSLSPSTSPSAPPTDIAAPSTMPSSVPSASPTRAPKNNISPSKMPSSVPSASPTRQPKNTNTPSMMPSSVPSASPTRPPKNTNSPSMMPSSVPSAPPTRQVTPTVDIVFQIDESESMGAYLSNVVNNVAFMFRQLATATSGSFRVGLVGYGGLNNGLVGYRSDNNAPRRLSVLTSNEESFLLALKQLQTNGLEEPGYDAIYETATETLPEGPLGINGLFCSILIGNEGPSGGTKSQGDAITAMNSAQGVQFVIVTDPTNSDYTAVATATGGKSYDITNFTTQSEAQQVLNDVLAVFISAPSMMPSSVPSASPSQRPILPPSPICEPHHTFKIVLSTASNGEALAWNLYRILPNRSSLFSLENSQGKRKKLIRSKSAGNYSDDMFYRETYKLGKGQYQFQIIGSASYQIILDGVVLREGDELTNSQSTFFTVGPKAKKGKGKKGKSKGRWNV